MSWTKKKPTVEGRYFWRCGPPRYEYGVCLIAWSRGLAFGRHVRQPELRLQSITVFGHNYPDDEVWKNHMGETSDIPQWSTTNALHQEIEFWYEPIQTPPDFPPVPGKPPDVPEEVVEEQRKEGERIQEQNEERAAERERIRENDIEDAVREGRTLVECQDCEETWDGEDLVLGRLRECPHCDVQFVEDECRNCPDCNRPFTRVEEQRDTCPGCYSSGEMPDLTVLVQSGSRQS